MKLWVDHRTPGPDAGADRLTRYMATHEFAALPEGQRRPYQEAFRRADQRGDVAPEQRRAVLGNLLSRPHPRPFDAYFALPPGKQREQFLDKVIDQQAKLQKQFRPPPPDDKGPKGINFDGKGLAESIPPEERAQMDQFMQDLHDRRTARGLPDNGLFMFTTN